MMKENNNPITKFVKPQGTTWKLGYFIFLILFTFSSKLFASENPSNENIVHADNSVDIGSDQKTENTEEPIIYVTKGVLVYGMENISTHQHKLQEEKQIVSQKKVFKKNITASKHKKEIPSKNLSRKLQKAEVPFHFASKNSQTSFEVAKQQSASGTLNFGNSFKAAILQDFISISAPYPDNTNSLYNYSLSFGGAKADFISFTRPPPFA